MFSPTNVLYAALAMLSFALWKNINWHRKHPKLPGPPSLPIIGNLHHIPLKHPWLRLASLTNQYGDAIYFHGLGNSILVLNSFEAINEILIRRDRIYCSRPNLVVASELFDLVKSTAFSPFNNMWKLHRKFARKAMNPDAIRSYEPTVLEVATVLNKELLNSPEQFIDSIRLAAGRVVISTIYGIHINSTKDSYIVTAEKAMDMISRAALPGKFLVDLLPVLKHIPEWFPGAGFHKQGREGREIISELTLNPMRRVQQDIADGTAPLSFTRDILMNPDGEDRKDEIYFQECVRWASASMYVAGQEVVAAPLINLLMGMATNPDKLRKAQEELDEVVGTDRVPTVQDRDSLPYVHAVCKELLRWHPPLPMSIIRSSIEDDVYRGCHIPKNTTIIPNIWTISRLPDPEYDPDTFAPERFLRDNPPMNPGLYCFGWGRRGCPAQPLAENFVFVMVASILSAFDISPSKDKDGIEIPMSTSYTNGLVSLPSDFRCSIKPRSEVHAKLWQDQVTPNYGETKMG